MRRILLIFWLALGLAFAQDTTCNTGDIAWVSATVNADVGLGAAPCVATAAGAEYNNIAAPFGIQAVADCACAGVDIRILLDSTNNYGSASTSWTNRDADKAIDWDLVAGAAADPIVVRGFSDATTEAKVTLDFTGGTSEGFITTQRHYIFKNIRLINATLDGWQQDTSGSQVYIDCAGESNGESGFEKTHGEAVQFIRTLAKGNTSHGYFLTQQPGVFYQTEAVDNGGNGYRCEGGQCYWFQALASGNTLNGWFLNAGEYLLAQVTAVNNTIDGIEKNAFSNVPTVIVDSITHGNVNGLDIPSGATVYYVNGNNYSGNTGANRNIVGELALDDDPTPDTADPTFVNEAGDNFEPQAAVGLTRTFPNATSSSDYNKGAIQTGNVSVGGAVAIIGAR